jgi:hypothetical protein
MRTGNGVIGVGHWVEMGSRRSGGNGRFFLLNPRDPWSWFMFPYLTLMAALGR